MKLEEFKGMEVLSNDGTYIGTIDGVIITSQWDVKAITLKLEKSVTEKLGQPKPLLFSPKMDLSVDHIDKMSDKLILKKKLDELQIYLKGHDDAYEAGRFRSMEVVDSEGKLLGHVDDIVLECKETCSQWKIPTILLKVEKDMIEILKLKGGFISAPSIGLSMKHVKHVGDVVMLDTDAKSLDEILEGSDVKKY